jgi:type I restriction enzyme R subunit
VVFEVDLLKSQEINLDYILELIFEHNKKIKSKSELVDEVRRVIRASLGNRAKESLWSTSSTRPIWTRLATRPA